MGSMASPAPSAIEWTGVTWNPVTGCTKVSPGCARCYAERLARRLRAMGSPKYAAGFEVALHRETLDDPLRWRQPRLVFVNSMSDLFHDAVPDAFVEAVFRTMNAATRHTFQVLTKRPERAAALARRLRWTANVWLGTSVETEPYLRRLEPLRRTPAAVKFLSLEPLLGPLPSLELDGVDWVIAGGESGPGARPLDPDWARAIRDKCARSGVPFFFKQWGGTQRKKAGRLLDGRTWDELPAAA